jgi:cyclopropane fatty-acyl-phospholipid synthase-like methyltransferase
MHEQFEQLLIRPEFPRASKYDADWILDNQMGPNALWLTEWLCQGMGLRPGMRVLDLGCGRALSSIFLAREYGLQVWATDLWIPATDNLQRIDHAGLSD